MLDDKKLKSIIISAMQEYRESDKLNSLKQRISDLETSLNNVHANFRNLEDKVLMFCKSCTGFGNCKEKIEQYRLYDDDGDIGIHCSFIYELMCEL